MPVTRKLRIRKPQTENPSLTSIGFQMHLAQSRLYSGVMEVLEGSGLNAGQLAILGALTDKGDMGQRQLGEVTRIEKSSMVLFLDDMEAMQLIERVKNPGDRRSYIIHLTDTGEKKLAGLAPRLGKVQDAFLAPLSRAEVRQFSDFLTRLAGES